jgi:hypothetical protein
MRDLSMHVLDLLENSIRAGGAHILVTVEEDPEADRLCIRVEDDGPGFPADAARVSDPFFTTKTGKRTGLGLSLFAAAAERAAGHFVMGRSSLGGALVEASLVLSHLDRCPLGDLAGSLCSIVCTHPGLELECRLVRARRVWELRVSDVERELGPGALRGLAVARKVSERIRQALGALAFSA